MGRVAKNIPYRLLLEQEVTFKGNVIEFLDLLDNWDERNGICPLTDEIVVI